MFFQKRILILVTCFIILFLSVNNIAAQEGEPTINIHDTVAAPGQLLLRIDALDFVGDNGQVAAITLRIEVDTLLIDFIGIQNMVLPGGWLANYNYFLNEITITYTAPFGMGFDINGKLLDLWIDYAGGFPAAMNFKSGCEVSNSSLQEINGIIFSNGTINQIAAEGSVQQDSLIALFDHPISMPVLAEGAGYNLVNGLEFRIAYDTTQIEYVGISEHAISDIAILNSEGILTIDWEDTISFYNFTSLDTLFFMNFNFIGDTNTSTAFLPGSKVYNNSIIVATDFVDGFIRAKLLVELLNNPDTAGTTLGSGYYFPNESVMVTAIPAMGFHFTNWTMDGNIVSSDSLFTFTKQFSNDTLTANFTTNLYSLSLIASPSIGGNVFGEGIYDYGESVTVSAVPSEGYEFLYWKLGDDIVSFDFFYTFTMPHNNLTLIAVFEMMVFTVTAIPNNPAYGTAEGGGDFNYGDTAILIATPNEDYKFVAWTEQGQLASYDLSYIFTVFSNHDMVANFQYDSECSAPVSLFSDENSETTALLHWLPSGSEDEWDLIWGEIGFDTINEGTLIEGLTESQYLLEDLDPGTLYDFYVRAVCTDELNSSWTGPETFATWYVGVDVQKEKIQVKVYPNPTSDVLHVGFPENVEVARYRIVNTLGIIKRESMMPISEHFSIQMNGLSQGVYYLQILIADQTITKVIIKD